MRRLVLAAMVATVAQTAQAGEFMDALRGGFFSETSTTSSVNWEGVYVGAQAGMGSSNMNFSGATKDLIAHMLYMTTIENEMKVSQWPVLGSSSSTSKGFGGFVGYNMQWDAAVIGVEASYLHGAFGGSTFGSMRRLYKASDGYTYDITSDNTAAMTIRDMATARIRGGWSTGVFLPYGFVGAAIGVGDVTRVAHVYGTGVNSSAPVQYQTIILDNTETGNQKNAVLFGYSAGLGVDMMLFGCVFVRGEWEYLRFSHQIDTSVNTFRIGAGYKF